MHVLADCTVLRAVKIGTQVTRINGAAFGNCIELQAVTHDKNAVVTDTGATLNNQMLTGVTMPNTVTILEQEAFQCCYELKSVR